MNFKVLFCGIFFCFLTINLKADSPVTSTIFYTDYLEHEIVQYVQNEGVLDERVIQFLLDADALTDVKAAVINALSWDYDGSSNSFIFLQALQTKYQSTTDILSIPGINPVELMCYGYLLAMDNYFDVFYAATITQAAADRSESFTIHLINAIVSAQKEFDFNWCYVWEVTRKVLNNNVLQRDMRRNTIQIVVDYMILYKGYC